MNCKHCGADLAMKRCEMKIHDGKIVWVRCPYDCLFGPFGKYADRHRVIEIRGNDVDANVSAL